MQLRKRLVVEEYMRVPKAVAGWGSHSAAKLHAEGNTKGDRCISDPDVTSVVLVLIFNPGDSKVVTAVMGHIP